MKRYGVVRCDEGGTLFDMDGNPIDHTWDVIDRSDRDRDGHPKTVQNCDKRATARQIAAELNTKAEEDRAMSVAGSTLLRSFGAKP